LPFESTAQQGFLEAHPEKVGGRAKLKEWEKATDFSHLPERKNMAKKGKHHEYSHTTTRHHHDGSHTVTHHHESGDPKKDKEYATLDHAGMMEGMNENLGPEAGAGGGAGGAEEAMEAGAAGGGAGGGAV
jgi:hypothetical protein